MIVYGMPIENHPTLKRAGSVDWGRIGYWVIKFFALVAMLAGLAIFIYGCWLVVGWVIANFAAIKRGFYTLVFAAIFFYAACALRAVAKYWQAKAAKLQTSKDDK